MKWELPNPPTKYTFCEEVEVSVSGLEAVSKRAVDSLHEGRSAPNTPMASSVPLNVARLTRHTI